MRASDYRRMARENMKGMWLKSAIVMLVVLLMCGLVSDIYDYGSRGISIYHLIVEYNNEAKEGSETTETTPAESGDSDSDSLLDYAETSNVPIAIEIINFIAIIFGGFFTLGHCKFLLNQYDGRKASISDLVSGKGLYTSSFLVELIKYVFIMLCNSLLPFIGFFIGIYLQYRYSMAMYILLENPDLRPERVVRESAKLMKGHKWELFCLDLSFVGWHLLGLLTLGIGNVFVASYCSASHAAFYRNLCPEIIDTEETVTEE